jgi:uncharacterized membrane protein
MDIFVVVLGCLAIGAIISGITMMIVRSKLKSVRAERTACNYTRSGSFKSTNQRDTFLFRRITKVPLPRNNNRGGRR